MHSFLLVIIIIIIRYGVLGIAGKDALKRAGFFPPVMGNEKVAFWVYQIANSLMLLYLLFLRIKVDSRLFYLGLAIYIAGVILYTKSMVDYAKPKENGINLNGLYKVSRNPMYAAYFIYFTGCALLTGSWIVLILLLIFQISVHWMILSEERWCINEFGEQYKEYMKKVRRYI